MISNLISFCEIQQSSCMELHEEMRHILLSFFFENIKGLFVRRNEIIHL